MAWSSPEDKGDDMEPQSKVPNDGVQQGGCKDFAVAYMESRKLSTISAVTDSGYSASSEASVCSSSYGVGEGEDESRLLTTVGAFEPKATWEVHKFGGTSLASADCYRRVACIVEEQIASNPMDKHLAVVVSAMGAHKPDIKVTDLLLSTVKHAAERDEVSLERTLDRILEKHYKCIADLSLGKDEEVRLQEVLQQDFCHLRNILTTVSLMKWDAAKISELVSGYGEIWSAQILAALLKHRARNAMNYDCNGELLENSSFSDGINHNFVYLDARRFIIIDEENDCDGTMCWEISRDKLDKLMQQEQRNQTEDDTSPQSLLHFVITGFVASNTQGVTATLQRDGSDYTGAIMGRLLQATSITIWTDVDGVLSANPHRVPDAHVIPEVSYNEALGLAYFGAKVIHAKTMQPAMQAVPEIPIYIRNTFNSSFPGSRIFTTSTSHTKRDRCVCGFSSVEGVALVSVEGIGLMGLHGQDKRLFRTLESRGVDVMLISQPSSEYSITFAIMESQTKSARRSVEDIFAKELKQNPRRFHHFALSSAPALIVIPMPPKSNVSLNITEPCSIIAAVGDGMSETAGVSGLFFSALGDAKISVLAISQGFSGRISAVIHTEQSNRALRAVHAAFRLSYTSIRVGIVGMNEIGHSLLRLLEMQRNKLRKAFEIDIQVNAVLSGPGSKGRLVTLADKSSSGEHESNSITEKAYNVAMGDGEPLRSSVGTATGRDTTCAVTAIVEGGLGDMLQHVVSNDFANSVIFDCSADEVVGKQHVKWLQAGVDVVTANSKAISGSRDVRAAIKALMQNNNGTTAKYLTEVTVGGALPLLHPLRDLLNSGDQIRRIDGIMSVSMSYIMNRIAPPPGVSDCNMFDENITKRIFRSSFSMSAEQRFTAGCSFSEAVEEAITLGLMETDPSRDLSNECVARCLMVLATELGIADGYDVEKIQLASDMLMVNVEESNGEDAVKMKKDDVEPFDKISARLDKQMRERVSQAAERGCVPRHISSIDVSNGQIDVKIMDVPFNHIFATTPPSCEVIRFFTETHKRYPLVIQGPAEGAASTASGLLAEFLHLMRHKVGLKTGRTLVQSNSGISLLPS